ncbi:hypothetical protein GCM10028803_33910 [Larkinella knui]|uniref:DUF4468 domain-containing protein n=1 Tax=Larkinella knui TaxID=2025310 RepID=A0A3P1CDF0_9BACT|nr:DUF4468 domain-containing protein [Larkinella knui]RRB11268.1 DUF4468 domain-containing protein [Larkinella knui]
MKFVFYTLLIAGMIIAENANADCPPVVTDGKIHGILPVINQKVAYAEVVDCGSVSQIELFRRARLWAAQSFRSASESFNLSDKETGDLVGKAVQVVTLPRSETSAGGVFTFRYTFVIECANRKYRATITHVELEADGKSVPVEVYCQKNDKDLRAIYTELDKQFKGVLASIQDEVKNYKAF